MNERGGFPAGRLGGRGRGHASHDMACAVPAQRVRAIVVIAGSRWMIDLVAVLLEVLQLPDRRRVAQDADLARPEQDGTFLVGDRP